MLEKTQMTKGIIGIDIGTTSTKAILYNEQLDVCAYANQGYPLYQEAPGMAELDPDEIVAAVVEVLRTVISEAKEKAIEIKGISFSSAMHSLIVMDQQNKALTRCLTWMDNRGAEASQQILTQWDGLELYKKTGTPIHSMTPFSKILYLKQEQPEIFAKAAKFIGIKEYLFYQFFGEYKVDYSIASATGLYNMQTRDWDTQILELLGIHVDQLSEIVAPTFLFTTLSPSYKKRLQLDQERLPFAIGSSDGCTANLGLGATDNQTVAITVGTSGAVRMLSDQPKIDPQGRTFCYAFSETKWLIGGATNNGGVIFQWLKQFLGQSDPKLEYQTLLALAAEAPAGAEGLIFLPYLAGERAPLWDANARGIIDGVSLQHSQKHFIRGTIEGIYYNIKLILELLVEPKAQPLRIKASGGFLQSALSRQILSDIIQQEIFVPESYESSCLGAALIGVEALETTCFTLEKVSSQESGHHHQPNTTHREVYNQSFTRYQQLLTTLT